MNSRTGTALLAAAAWASDTADRFHAPTTTEKRGHRAKRRAKRIRKMQAASRRRNR